MTASLVLPVFDDLAGLPPTLLRTYRAAIPSVREDLAALLDLAVAMLKEVGAR